MNYSLKTLLLSKNINMERIARAFLIASSVAYTVILFYTYAYFAELSLVKLNLLGNTYEFSNNTFFYTALIIPLFFILICIALASLIIKQPFGGSYFFKTERVRNRMYGWAVSLGGALNLFFASLLTVLIFTNNEEGLNQNGYIPLVVASMLVVLFWLFWLPFILSKNK